MAVKTLSEQCMDIHDYLIAIERNRQMLEAGSPANTSTLEINAKLYEYGLNRLKELVLEARRAGDKIAVWVARSIYGWLSEADDNEFWEDEEIPAFMRAQ